ncbi:hypothetical protein [Streptomyces sp. DB-54]
MTRQITDGQIWALVVFLGLIAVMLVRSSEVKLWQALCLGFLGFFIAMNPLGYAVAIIVNMIAGFFK